MSFRRSVARLGLVAAIMVVPAAHARPLYFQNLTNIYGITPSESIYACGICHRRWEGTGGRNPYGTAVEQQLYLGKSIVDAILDIAAEDTDLDGFTNGDELGTHRTLPGYSCANYDLVINPPADFQSLITPGVPTCLEPKDVRVDPETVTFITLVGQTETVPVEIHNNGSEDPLAVTDIAFLPGAPPSLTLSAPALPLVIPVGQSASVDVTFAPTGSGLASGTLRVTSDDPDESQVDVAVTALGFVQQLAPPDVRGACLKDAERQLERLTKVHLRAWGDCFLDELRGVACDTAKRDLKIGKAEAKLRAVVGGDSDRTCAANMLSPSRLGLPAQCGAPCGTIALTTIARLADCMVCRQTAATNAMLAAAVGTTPPDVPSNQLAADAWRCNEQLVTGVEKGVRNVQRLLGRCELEAVLAGTSADCPTALAQTLADEAAKVEGRLDRCRDTTGLLGCLFAPGDPGCLGEAATQIGTDLVETVFGPN